MDEVQCSSCRFWCRVAKSRLGELVGECRYNPPMVYPGPEFQADRKTIWPRTESVDWCGKHETRSDEAA